MDKLHTPIGALARHWEELVDDMEAIAAGYRDEGATVLELHPGDVTAVTGPPFTLNVLVPDNEADDLETILARSTLETGEVLRSTVDGLVLGLLVLEAASTGDVVLCPMYYGEEAGDRFREEASEEEIVVHLRRLTDDTVVSLSYDDPQPFFER